MSTPEKKVKDIVKKELTIRGVYFFSPAANGYGRSGISDIIGCCRGLFIAVECKAGNKRPTALQQRELDRITAAGGFSMCVNETNMLEFPLALDLWMELHAPNITRL